MATRKSKKKKSALAPKKKTAASKKSASKSARKAAPKSPPKKAAKKLAKKSSKKSGAKVKAAPARSSKLVAKSAKKSPSKKKTAAPPKAKANAKATKTSAKPARKGKAPASYLGRADSMNASISLLLVDGAAAANAWRHVDPDDIDSIEKTASITGDLAAALDTGASKKFDLGGTEGVGFQLSVGKGIAHVFRAKDRIVIAEGFVDDVENDEFLGYVAGAPAKDANIAGTFDVKSGVVAMLLPGGTYEDLPARLKADIGEHSAARIGSETPGLLVKVPAGRYRVLVEGETTGGFGQAARAVVERE